MKRTCAVIVFAGASLWGLNAEAAEGDTLADSVAVGDFNCDGYDDYAVGSPGRDAGADARAGAVSVIYTHYLEYYLETTGESWNQDSSNVEGVSNPYDEFGASLAAGDFDGDGCDDLAVGVPYEDVSGTSNAGAVNILYGSSSGITATGDQLWTQDSSGVLDAADNFGLSVTVGDFNCDARDDLAIGVPYEDFNSTTNGGLAQAGMVNVIYGASGGLSSAGQQGWHQDTSGISGACESYDYFGRRVAAGDLNSDGKDELIVGVPDEAIGATPAVGAFHVIGGTSSGLSSANEHMQLPPGYGIGYQYFGDSLAMGKINYDGYADLAVGAPRFTQWYYDEGIAYAYFGASSFDNMPSQAIYRTRYGDSIEVL